MKNIILLVLFAIHINYGQNPLNVGNLQISNDNIYNTTLNSGNVAKMVMGFDGATGYIKFGAHNGNGYRDNIFYVRGIDGNVGIGTTNPRASLDVANYIPNEQIGTVFGRLGEGDEAGSGTFLGVQGHSTQGSDYGNVKSFSIVHNFYGQTNNSINFYRGSGTTGGFMTFCTDNNNEKMRIAINGNIGIGTTAPDEKLTVKGKIHTQEVRVDMAGPLVPDYVFAEDYKLKSLKEVEDYIKENKHLPEVPSAHEIEKNGLMLAEMNMSLLKKVEELTLYVIEMKKENEFQKNLLKIQDEKILQLEKKINKILK